MALVACGTPATTPEAASRIATPVEATLRARDDYPGSGRGEPAPATPQPGAATEPSPAAAEGSGPPNRLRSADGTLDVAVGTYTDCSGNSPIDATQADLDPCFLGRLYFVGHSSGAFSPLLAMHPGATLTWFDARGRPTRLRVIAERTWWRNSGPLTLARPDVTAQFQTCLSADGSIDRILDAVPA